jgi:hypothetical protein
MKACVNAFRLQKAGNAPSEYEDAFWPRTSCEESFPLRVAAADGATDAVYSGLWANILVRSWGRRDLNNLRFARDVAQKAKLWQRIIRHRQLPWYVEEKARSGTYAAFAGVELDNTPGLSSGSWMAVACGDCCLFQIRGPELQAAFPVARSDDFTNSPVLLSTRTMRGDDVSAIQIATGAWEEGDCLYLMTDALACWFLGKCEAGEVPWQLLMDITLAGDPPFPVWINGLRERNELKNDDCTLISITFE